MLATPNYSHLKNFPNVYDPSEDTFLLIDALEHDLLYLRNLKPEIVVEVGSGSGIVVNFLATNLKTNNPTPFLIATDINKDACLATQQASTLNSNSNVEIVNCDMFLPMLDRLERKVDILIFNHRM